MSDEDIDFSDILPLDEDFFQNAKKIVRKFDQNSSHNIIKISGFITAIAK